MEFRKFVFVWVRVFFKEKANNTFLFLDSFEIGVNITDIEK